MKSSSGGSSSQSTTQSTKKRQSTGTRKRRTHAAGSRAKSKAPSPYEIGQQLGVSGVKVIRSARQTIQALDETKTYLRDTLYAHTAQKPYVALGAAASIGFVCGGGLTLRMTSMLARWGTRMLLSAAITQFTDLDDA